MAPSGKWRAVLALVFVTSAGIGGILNLPSVAGARGAGIDVNYCGYPNLVYPHHDPTTNDCRSGQDHFYDRNTVDKHNTAATNFEFCEYMSRDFRTPYISYKCTVYGSAVTGFCDDRGYVSYPNYNYDMYVIERNDDPYNARYLDGRGQY